METKPSPPEEDLKPICVYLHVWTEAERAMRIKKATTEAAAERLPKQSEENKRDD